MKIKALIAVLVGAVAFQTHQQETGARRHAKTNVLWTAVTNFLEVFPWGICPITSFTV
jgi:hypothetical protein